jgi:hypothetical protein
MLAAMTGGERACVGCLGNRECWVCLGTGRWPTDDYPRIGPPCTRCAATGLCSVCVEIPHVTDIAKSGHGRITKWLRPGTLAV